MDLQCSCNSLSNGHPKPQLNGMPDNYSQINHTSVAGEQSTDIKIVTKEGDKVTLSSDIQLEASLTTYNSIARTNGTYTESKGKLFSFDANKQFTIGVEGDLNDQEKKEIKKVIKTIFKMVKNFLSGNDDQLTKKARKLANLNSISNVEAEFEFNKSIAKVDHFSAESVTNSPIPEKPNPSETEANESNDAFNPVTRLTDRMAQHVKDSGIKPVKLLKYADRMFSKLFRGFLKEGSAGWEKMNSVQRIMTDFFQKLEKLSAESEEDDHQDTGEAEKEDTKRETAHLEQTSLLQAGLLEHSNTLRMTYSADD